MLVCYLYYFVVVNKIESKFVWMLVFCSFFLKLFLKLFLYSLFKCEKLIKLKLNYLKLTCSSHREKQRCTNGE